MRGPKGDAALYDPARLTAKPVKILPARRTAGFDRNRMDSQLAAMHSEPPAPFDSPPLAGGAIPGTQGEAAFSLHHSDASPVPVLIGFGIKDAASAAAMAPLADGIVVGSALVEHLAGAANPQDAAERAGAADIRDLAGE